MPSSITSPASSSSDRIQVVSACNAGYFPYVAALIASLSASRNQASGIDLTMLHQGVSVGAQRRIEEFADGVAVHWVEVSADSYAAAGLPTDETVVRPHYFRCLMGSVLPPSARRAIYIDADAIVLDDLQELWQSDLDGKVLGAASDYFLPRCRDAVGPWQELGLDPEAPYFNSGVMLVDLDRWRTEDVASRVLRRCCDSREHLLAQGKWPQYDQFGLNVVLQGQWHLLSQDWNYLSELPEKHPHVVHFCGGGKPGSPTCGPLFTELFDSTLAGTPWSGWRPGHPAISVA
jgi:lipopolysaccharide biosynthesis glycosyltransferase